MLVCGPTAVVQESLSTEETLCWHSVNYKTVALMNEWMREEVCAVIKFMWMLNMESVNFHTHYDCVGQMLCPSNRCKNGAATVNKCRGQEQKWHSLSDKHVCH